MTKNEAISQINKAQRLLAFLALELGESDPSPQVVSALAFDAMTAIVKANQSFGHPDAQTIVITT